MRYRRFVGRYVTLVTIVAPPATDYLRGPRAAVSLAPARWRPATDVSESAGGFSVTVELAGVDPEALDVQLYEDALVVEGTRLVAGSGGVYHSAEIRQGPFRVEVPLPGAIDPERIDAHFDRGLLQITPPGDPKRPETRRDR
ncbi:MAG TPA: Hsp20/alpha crystallin family protein [Chloroflexota bacterium]|nr:Hsp20/alpha crystallin family protein [Chloroflexota bacterium]